MMSARRFLFRHRFLLARRSMQMLILLAFGAGPLLGVAIAQGTLASSLWLGTVPLSDPLVLLQSLLAGHPLAGAALLGGLLIAGFYALAGGRSFCAWVCPINLVTDAAAGARRRLGWRRGAGLLRIDRRLRLWILGACLLGSLLGGVVIWETINPINLVMRAVAFGLWGGGLIAIAAIFLFDLLVVPNGWCGHLCPVGAFYGQLGRGSVAQVSATRRDDCNHCGDCFVVCPEPQVISPALRGIDGHAPGIIEPDCIRCGRCIEVCEQSVFEFKPGLPGILDGGRPLPATGAARPNAAAGRALRRPRP